MTPTEFLTNEHRLIVEVLDCLEEAADRLDSDEDVKPDFFIDAAEFVAGFADRCHHAKEEDILFVAMTARDMPQDSGPVAVMLQEHELGRAFTAGFRSAAEQMKSGDESAAADVVRNVYDYVNLLREHINKEDNVLFPMADQIIPPDTMETVSKEFDRVIAADDENGIPEKYVAIAKKLADYLSRESTAA
jgi:hemerythrin-like domain-containing protein